LRRSGGAADSAGLPTKAFAQAKPHRIDVHHHLSPPPWVDALRKAGLDTPPVTSWTPQRSLDDDETKIQGLHRKRRDGRTQTVLLDTAQASNPIAMGSLTKMVAVSQIVFGTDYPYRSAADQVKGLSEVFGAEDLKKIDRENALRLLPRWRAGVPPASYTC
jgi:hypothetical protein